MLETVTKILGFVDDAITVVGAILDAAREGDFPRVDEILGDELQSALALKAAEVRARGKFGERS